ncbi:barrier-to-autointegration factor [Drosophila busckii]|uniref:barrier-to-autointegration factor n=1 Tax=Drosophila busckii TaxID=30019 RepID=UPI0014332607|nr:barrier-to-autointegration factor [Drosophila busckii]
MMQTLSVTLHRNIDVENKTSGIGETLGGRLSEAGFDKAYTVLGQYLVLKKDEELFKEWMKDVCHASSKQALDCYSCLHDWCEEFL